MSLSQINTHTYIRAGSSLWLIPNSCAYESMENSDHIPVLSFLSFHVIFTHFHFTLFKLFFHLFLHNPLFLLAVTICTPPPPRTTFPVCVLQLSGRVLDRTAELQSSTGGTTSLKTTHCNNPQTVFWCLDRLVGTCSPQHCSHDKNKMLRWCKVSHKDSVHEKTGLRICVQADQEWTWVNMNNNINNYKQTKASAGEGFILYCKLITHFIIWSFSIRPWSVTIS